MRRALRLTGYAAVFIGLVGLVAPRSLGVHAGLWHNAMHLAAGLFSLRVARLGTPAQARQACLLLALGYLTLGAIGLASGAPGYPMPGVSDLRLLRLIPGVLELGTFDHAFHLLAGALCALAGLRPKPEPAAPGAVRRKETAVS